MDKYFQVLSEWNFWDKKPDAGKKRPEYTNKIMPLIGSPEVLAVTGVRRSGKSTILLQLMKELHQKNKVPYRNILYVNFEDPRLGDDLKANDLFNLLQSYKNNLKPRGKIFLFLDEVQNVSKWEKFVRTIYDQKRNIKIVVTGSTSRTFESKLINLLGGRLVLFTVTPLSFSEFLEFKNKKLTSSNIYELIDEYMLYGGFPRIVLENDESQKRMILVSYYSTIVEKDVILRNNIKNKLELKQLVRFVMSNISSLVSSYSIEKILKISSVLINTYLNYLEESFIISRVPVFSYSVKDQIYNPDKVYCVDPGLANIAGFSFSENKGKLLENLVFNRLKKDNQQIYYWKNGAEIDFLLFYKSKVRRLINVTTTVDNAEVLKRELTSLETGAQNFPKAGQQLISLYNESKQMDSRISSLLSFLVTPPGVEPEFTG
jgi:predicted AAA+ superfamily ATPase